MGYGYLSLARLEASAKGAAGLFLKKDRKTRQKIKTRAKQRPGTYYFPKQPGANQPFTEDKSTFTPGPMVEVTAKR